MNMIFILGSHNSLSYLPIKHWWQRCTAPWARCQSLTLKQQHNLGVALFDIRVRIKKDSGIVFCHNATVFKYSVEQFYKDVIELHGTIMLRFILDERKMPKNAEKHKQIFLDFVQKTCKYMDDKIILTEARVFWEWKDYASDLCKLTDDRISSMQIVLHEIYSSVSRTFFKLLPPKWFASVFNKQLNGLFCIERKNHVLFDNHCIMLDYVEKI